MSSRVVYFVIETLFRVCVETIDPKLLSQMIEQRYQIKAQGLDRNILVTQLEQDTIAFVEKTCLSRNYLVDYLISGNISGDVKKVSIDSVATPLAAFLQGDTSEKPPQVSTLNYVNLRDLRESGNGQAYYRTLYRICRLYYPTMKVMNHALALTSSSPALAGVARNMPQYQISQTVMERAIYHTKAQLKVVRANDLQYPDLAPKS